jgi:hypothetical protein
MMNLNSSIRKNVLESIYQVELKFTFFSGHVKTNTKQVQELKNTLYLLERF